VFLKEQKSFVHTNGLN